jgi:hypothetical protein
MATEVDNVLQWTTSWNGQHLVIDSVLKWPTSYVSHWTAFSSGQPPALDSVLQSTTSRSGKPPKTWTTSWNGIGQTPFIGQRLAMYNVLQRGTSRDGRRPTMDNCKSSTENIHIFYKSSAVSIAWQCDRLHTGTWRRRSKGTGTQQSETSLTLNSPN